MLCPSTKKLQSLCIGHDDLSKSGVQLEVVEISGEDDLPELPWDPMWAQVDFRMQSSYFLKLYGYEYDYGILPNVDLEIKYAVSGERQAAPVDVILTISSTARCFKVRSSTLWNVHQLF